jgi:hypothetical protein
MDKQSKQFIEMIARASQINNAGVGKVTAIGNDGRHTVQLDGGRMIQVFNASGQSLTVGDTVGIRFLGGDKRQAEISGRSTRRFAKEIRRVWR